MNFDFVNILITGGTGSLGNALTKHLLSYYNLNKLIIFSRDEHKQVEMFRQYPNPEYPIRYIIGDIRDRNALYRALKGVDIVIHAAALKHVSKCEYSPDEAIATNIIGTQNVINMAIERNVQRCLLISSDKAVNPNNLYGHTKAVAEKLFHAASSYAGKDGTIFSVIRFGNFIGSRGSVIPYFQSIKSNGVLPITHRSMTRFVIPLPTAAQRVCDAIETMRGNEIFCPIMKSIKVTDIAEAVDPLALIDEIGIQAGEKLHEDMIIEQEANCVVRTKDNLFYVLNSGKCQAGDVSLNGFYYRSDMNKDWMTAEELRTLINQKGG